MADINLTTRVKEFFFDKEAILAKVDKARVAVLSKAGAFIRRTAQQSMRQGGKNKKPSSPGRPPKVWVGLLKQFLYFSYDPNSKSVVIGPTALNQYHVMGGQLTRGAVPKVLEEGGTIGFREEQLSGGLWIPFGRSRRQRAGRPTRVRNVTIAARPYMVPARDKNMSKFPELWSNSVRP